MMRVPERRSPRLWIGCFRGWPGLNEAVIPF
jgi:hypothetical protein